MGILEKVKKWLDEKLDTDYLFNENQKRVRVNMAMLIALLIANTVVGGIPSLLAHRGANIFMGVLLPTGLGLLVFFLINRTPNTTFVLNLSSVYIIADIWLQFIFIGERVNYMIFLAYPILVCFFMGNSFGIKFVPLLYVNLLICTWAWREPLNLAGANEQPFVYTHFNISFICVCVMAFAIEYMHNRTFTHLTSLTNQITDNSYSDPLTRLLTRRAFNERFSAQLEEQAAAGRPLFIIMCDIDHFKSVNDNYGHQTGDDVLKHVSGILSKYAVGKDLCFRWGGEEFLIFLHEKTLQKAIDAANRIRVVLEYTPFLSGTAGVIKVTMSFGLHQYDTTMSMDKNISVADGYLYAAKNNGRNRVEHA